MLVTMATPIFSHVKAQGPEEMCLSLEHQNLSKTSGKMGYFDHVDDRVTVSLHILYTTNQETEGLQDHHAIASLNINSLLSSY